MQPGKELSTVPRKAIGQKVPLFQNAPQRCYQVLDSALLVVVVLR